MYVLNADTSTKHGRGENALFRHFVCPSCIELIPTIVIKNAVVQKIHPPKLDRTIYSEGQCSFFSKVRRLKEIQLRKVVGLSDL